jgi:hypothetical protein
MVHQCFHRTQAAKRGLIDSGGRQDKPAPWTPRQLNVTKMVTPFFPEPVAAEHPFGRFNVQSRDGLIVFVQPVKFNSKTAGALPGARHRPLHLTLAPRGL